MVYDSTNDDVLYVTENECGADIYYIFHLTYSENNSDGSPQYTEFKSIHSVKDFIKQSFIQSYM